MNRILPFLAWFFGSLCFGLLFIAIFTNATEIDCAHQLNKSYTCQFRTLFLGKILISKRQAENIVDIKMERDYDSETGTSYRAEFVTSDGDQIPLSVVWTDFEPVSDQVNSIGSQIHSGADQITYRVEPSWWVLYLIGGLTIMSMLLSTQLLFKPKTSSRKNYKLST
jgi:hypothetical protein